MPVFIDVTIENESPFRLYLQYGPGGAGWRWVTADPPPTELAPGGTWTGRIESTTVPVLMDFQLAYDTGTQTAPGRTYVSVWFMVTPDYIIQNTLKADPPFGPPELVMAVPQWYHPADGRGAVSVMLSPYPNTAIETQPVSLPATIPALTPANAIGQGFDIFGVYSVADQVLPPLFDPGKASTQSFKFQGVDYTIPSYLQAVQDPDSRYDEDVAETRDDFQSSLAVNVGVAASYGAFSGQMNAAFSKQVAQNAQFNYAYRFYYSRLARLAWTPELTPAYLSDDLQAAIAALPATLDDLAPFAQFFDRFGIYFVSGLHLGASLEYYSAVSTTSSLSTLEIGAMVKAEYNALFSSGGISASIKDTTTWKNYASNRQVSIRAAGGDPGLAAQVASVDPDAIAPTGPDTFVKWVNSAGNGPAIVDFSLSGIWNLCGGKSGVVEQAFELYGQRMRPRLTIEASTEPWQTPVIILGSQIKPVDPPQFSAGYHVIVLNRENISPAGVLLNHYFSFDPADSVMRIEEYLYMYKAMIDEIELAKLEAPGYVIIVASFGLPNNAGPPRRLPIRPDLDAYAFFADLGGTSNLQLWADTSDPGSRFWENCIYALVGIPGYGAGTGIDLYQDGPGTATLDVLFYREQGRQAYTLGLGSGSSAKSGADQVERFKRAVAAESQRRLEARATPSAASAKTGGEPLRRAAGTGTRQ